MDEERREKEERKADFVGRIMKATGDGEETQGRTRVEEERTRRETRGIRTKERHEDRGNNVDIG